ncbi:ArsR family transcriptional regulator [Alkalicoccus daliensis]|uniref:Cell wall-binding repeat-containing protein n=1 Tax=Alkalicoccus daliensis TaxID=745820 RepID=A0A1G9Z8N0_9BACI|nr:ArsR family transcriptional regulator [Alkalicoccus daliensis]SDN17719.1 hypothetical protein SAMN04488053_1012 [Alkalicoccus daliensis]
MNKTWKLSSVVTISSVLLLAACNGGDNETAANENASGNGGSGNDTHNNHMNEDMNEHMNENMEEHMNENMNNHMDHNEDMNEHGEHMDDHEEHMNGNNEAREAFEEEAAQLPESWNDNAGENLQVDSTKNITRLSGNSVEEMSVIASQTIWPATHEANQPGTVILAEEDEWQHALAALTLVHHPNDGPLLLMEDGLTEDLVAEIERLAPLGNEEGIEVLVAADLSAEEEEMLEGFETDNVYEEDPAQFAKEIEESFAEIIGELPDSVIIGSMEEEHQASSLLAGSWIAHMNESLLYVNEEIPAATKEALEARNGEANMYLLGNDDAISSEVEEELEEFGNVVRIEGDTPAELSIAFAEYQDDSFGWGIDEPGHGLVFASVNEPELAMPAMPLAHLGKHAPLIWMEEELEQPHADYLAKLKPSFEEAPMEGPYNHGYVIGGEDTISFQAQGTLDALLEIEQLDGDGHGDH